MEKRTVIVTGIGGNVGQGIIRNIRFSKYPVKEIIVTENGAAFPDLLINGRVHDQQRIEYYKQYLKSVLRAKNDGANV